MHCFESSLPASVLTCFTCSCGSPGALPTLLALLAHENTDIAADVIELLQELTDADVVEDQVRRREGRVEAGDCRLRGGGQTHC